MTYDRYIALGDSISIDLYPSYDNNGSEHFSAIRKIGAASLLFKNDNRLWPDFRGRDLSTLFPACEFVNDNTGAFPGTGATDNFTADGATTVDVHEHLKLITASDEATLITLTVGGNDLLTMIGVSGALRDEHMGDFRDENPSAAVAHRVEKILAALFEKRPHATVLLSTVYDPSDGTNMLPVRGEMLRLDIAAGWLRDYNDRLRKIAQSDSRIRLADIHAHFLGHGLTTTEENRWYWRDMIIEPSARGASEIRRVWLDALLEAPADELTRDLEVTG